MCLACRTRLWTVPTARHSPSAPIPGAWAAAGDAHRLVAGKAAGAASWEEVRMVAAAVGTLGLVAGKAAGAASWDCCWLACINANELALLT